MNEAVVIFEKAANGVKATTKIRRRSVPGIIEREEMLRADLIEADLYLRTIADKHHWYNTKDE